MSDAVRTESPVKAKRGGLAVLISRSGSTSLHGEDSVASRISLARVSGVTRAGLVTRYKEALFAEGAETEYPVERGTQVQIVGAGTVDVEAVLAEFRKRTWRATTGSDSDMLRPYESLDDVRSLVKRHVRTSAR